MTRTQPSPEPKDRTEATMLIGGFATAFVLTAAIRGILKLFFGG